jgi:DNA-binding MarR family transcriptional regulator
MANTVSSKVQNPAQPDAISDATLRKLFGYNIKRASNVIQSDLASTLKPFDLRMITFTALTLIVDNPGLRQSQLADMLAIERPNLVAIIDELEQRQLVSRGRASSDRRANSLTVTLAGRHLHQKALGAVMAHEQALLAAIPEKERGQIVASLRLIERAGG